LVFETAYNLPCRLNLAGEKCDSLVQPEGRDLWECDKLFSNDFAAKVQQTWLLFTKATVIEKIGKVYLALLGYYQ
jgi:hypothetical protein